jgi:hypothetical protein
MTTAIRDIKVAGPAVGRSGLDRVRRTATAAAAVIGPWGFVAANASYAWATRHGGSDSDGPSTLALYAQVPDLVRFALVAAMVACLLIGPAIAAGMRTAARSWLAFVGGTLMIGGYICYFGVANVSALQLAMAVHGGPVSDFAAVIDASDPAFSWTFFLFIVGNLLGTVLFAIGLLRSRALPVWACVLILCWPVSHVLGLSIGTEVPEVIGGALQAVGFAVLGIRGLRPAE